MIPGGMFVSARAFSEYTGMFDLGAEELSGSILDCAGGAASFTAEANARGITARSADPLYRRSLEEIQLTVRDGVEQALANIAAEPERYDWEMFDSADAHGAARRAAAQTFMADLGRHPERYVAAELPELPFPDRSFDLVLCSHLLFTYAQQLSFEFHTAAILEMARVTRGEVRVFPTVAFHGDAGAHLDRLAAQLEPHGLLTAARAVPYRFQRGATTMLTVRRG